MNTGAVVTFQIKILNYGNTSNPFFIISKQVPVVNGSASAIFESLPTTTILGQIHIENGKIQGYSDFHGALDLIQGENTVTLAPVGSLMPQDVVAKALSEIISSSTLFLSAPQSLVSELNNIVSVLLLDSSAVYNEVINNFTNRNGLPVVELVSPNINQTFVAGDNIAIIASATDMDGSIAKVEFFQGTNKVGEALALPFFCTWKPLSTGYYSLTAKAFDNNSAVGVTSPVLIQVISKETPVGYTVAYNGNGNTGGSVPTDNLTYQQSATVTVKDNVGNLVRTDYTFAGWNTKSDGSGQDYLANSTFLISRDIVLYAKWQSSLYSWSPGSVTVSDTNFTLGRPTATYTGTSYSSESAVDGNPMTRWSGNRDDLGPDESNPHFLIVDFQQIREVRSIKVNIAGWDSWKQNFSIYTSADLQSWSLVASEQDKTGILSYNLQPISIRYVKFSSTYSADNGQVNLYELEVYGTEQAVNTCTVTYNGNGNTSGSVPTDVLTYQQSATVTVKDNAGNLVKTGYTFAGWNTAADGSGTNYDPAATFSMGSANVTLYAKWSLVPAYTVTYNGNGNTGGTVPTDDNQAYQQGAIVTAKDNAGNLTKTGYAFSGWNTAADGSGINYSPNSTFAIGTESLVFYAKWLPVPTYTVTYNGNGNTGGSAPTDNLVYQQNATVIVKDNIGNLVKKGYIFEGWNTSADGSGTDYLVPGSFIIGVNSVTLYAKWIPKMPDAPTNFSVIPGNGKNSLTWDLVEGGTSYNVYYSTTRGVTRESGIKIENVASQFIHDGLSNATYYYYIVTTVDEQGESEPSLEACSVPHPFSKGDGSLEEPYEVLTAIDLNNVRYFPAAHFRQLANIDLSHTKLSAYPWYDQNWGWQPISSFSGTFNGNGFLIMNLYIVRVTSNNVALISSVENDSLIENVLIEGANVKGYDYTAALVGINKGNIRNCSVSGFIEGNDNTGGIIGESKSSGIVENCENTASIKTTKEQVGGLTGSNRGTIKSSINRGTINSNARVGGISGVSLGLIIDCQNFGNITGQSVTGGLVGYLAGGQIMESSNNGLIVGNTSTGGLVGWNYGLINNCQNKGVVSGVAQIGGIAGYNKGAQILGCQNSNDIDGSENVGGLVGENRENASIAASSNIGNIDCDGNRVGGIVGYSYFNCTVSNCFNTGNVTGSSEIGGLIGSNYGSNVIDSFSSGRVIGTGIEIGGLIGVNDYGSISKSFWDKETSEQNASAGGIGYSTIEMKQASTYNGWDFTGIWQMLVDSYPSIIQNPTNPIIFVP